MPPPIWIPYCGAAPVPAEILSRWNLDPVLIGLLLLSAFLLARTHPAEGAGPKTRRRLLAAFYGLLVLLFISPFCALTSALFSARAVHHILLLAVAAPLLAAARKAPSAARLAVGRATVLQALVFWIWHAPGLYAWALSSDAAYWLMQISLLAVGWAFWTAVSRASPPAAVAALLGTVVQMGLLGALLTFAPEAFYAPHFTTGAAWGLSPLEDQQLAGLIMWVPAALFYLVAALVIAGRWIGPDQPRAAQG